MRNPAPLLLFLAGLLSVSGPGPAAAQDRKPEANPFGEEGPEPLTEEQEKEAEKLFGEARTHAAKGAAGFARARQLFRRFLKNYPGAGEEMLREAEDRSGENCLVGIELMHEGGPSERRIDVELMGDGYVEGKYRSFLKDAPNQMKEFWAEPLYAEYANYFNVWRFDLISAEDGVDELSMEERMGQPPPEPEPGKRKKKGPKKYSTALNCVAAGPQNQVWADPEQVHRWRRYLPESDGLTIAFAKKGQLGMGGMGIATTGKRVAVVHEFGHAFVGLLDEYANNPNRPQGHVFAANAVSTRAEDPREPPPREEIPWKHWLALRNSPVGVFLGGATYKLGVFRPAPGCAMNSGGGGNYCWVCREAGVLRIYSYLSPVDEALPVQDVVTLAPKESKEFSVVPMAPRRHRLEVDWFMQRLSTGELLPAEPASPEDGEVSTVEDDRARGLWRGDGDRGYERRRNPLPAGDPLGYPLKAKEKGLRDNAFRSTVLVEGLEPGTWRLTVRVRDDAKLSGQPFPWVIKDTARLLEEWRTWRIDVVARTGEDAPPPPSR